MTDRAEPEIIFERRGAAGLVTLNRPKALNALSREMMRAMHAQLLEWEADEAVTRIVVRGRGERAFCAGGDIRHVYDLGKAGRIEEAEGFFADEYALDACVQRLSKPYIALIEGIVMGGGVGISLHGDFRVAGENYVFAMPETGIGYFPDVGMTYALPRLPGRTGTYLALTGARIGRGDAFALGIATHAAAASRFDDLTEALGYGGDVAKTLDAFSVSPPEPGPLADARGLVDECFGAQSVGDILGRLDIAASSGAAFAADAAALIRSRSPTSVLVAFEQMRRGPGLSFAEAMLAEYRLATRFLRGHDLYEGVRAALVDKDGRPAWKPGRLDAVDPEAITAAFGPTDGPEPRFG